MQFPENLNSEPETLNTMLRLGPSESTFKSSLAFCQQNNMVEGLKFKGLWHPG